MRHIAPTSVSAWVQVWLRLLLLAARHCAIRPCPGWIAAHLLSMSARHWLGSRLP